MPRTQNRAVMKWIFTFASLAAFLVVFGGFVRLTRSGLSIVEWSPVTGAIPPLDQRGWQAEFEKYRGSPEYIQVNSGMTLDQYKEIYLIEWAHRLIARLAGLVFALPFAYFLYKKRIPWSESGLYVVMGFLFIGQAVMGWAMVSSGLVDRPSVSHYLLTAHLFLALTLIGLALWTALGHLYGFPEAKPYAKWSSPSKLVAGGLAILLIQIAYGGFTAGLKAGHVSDTWPLMFGQLLPGGLLSQVQPPLLNLFEAPATVMFIHRWFAMLGLIFAVIVFWKIRRAKPAPDISVGLNILMLLVCVQIGLGISVVLLHVEIAIALIHQTVALSLFAATVYVLHRLRAADARGTRG